MATMLVTYVAGCCCFAGCDPIFEKSVTANSVSNLFLEASGYFETAALDRPLLQHLVSGDRGTVLPRDSAHPLRDIQILSPFAWPVFLLAALASLFLSIFVTDRARRPISSCFRRGPGSCCSARSCPGPPQTSAQQVRERGSRSRCLV